MRIGLDGSFLITLLNFINQKIEGGSVKGYLESVIVNKLSSRGQK